MQHHCYKVVKLNIYSVAVEIFPLSDVLRWDLTPIAGSYSKAGTAIRCPVCICNPDRNYSRIFDNSRTTDTGRASDISRTLGISRTGGQRHSICDGS